MKTRVDIGSASEITGIMIAYLASLIMRRIIRCMRRPAIWRSEPLAMMDICPTFLKLAGVSLAGECRIDGRDIMPLLCGEAGTEGRQLFWEYHQQSGVREGRWKLVLNGMLDMDRTEEDPVHLSDLSADPGERINLAGDYPEVTERLKRDIQHWLAEVHLT